MEPARLPRPPGVGRSPQEARERQRLPDPPQGAREKGCYVTFEAAAGGPVSGSRRSTSQPPNAHLLSSTPERSASSLLLDSCRLLRLVAELRSHRLRSSSNRPPSAASCNGGFSPLPQVRRHGLRDRPQPEAAAAARCPVHRRARRPRRQRLAQRRGHHALPPTRRHPRPLRRRYEARQATHRPEPRPLWFTLEDVTPGTAARLVYGGAYDDQSGQGETPCPPRISRCGPPGYARPLVYASPGDASAVLPHLRTPRGTLVTSESRHGFIAKERCERARDRRRCEQREQRQDDEPA